MFFCDPGSVPSCDREVALVLGSGIALAYLAALAHWAWEYFTGD